METGGGGGKKKHNDHTKPNQPINLLDVKAEISNVPERLFI